MPPPRVLVLHNEPVLPPDHPDADSEHDVLYTADVVARTLQQAGVPVRRLGVADDMGPLVPGLLAHAPDVVFNLYEGTAQWGNTEAYVAGILEWLQVPFTGSPFQPITLCRSKPLTKSLLAGAGLPTARFFSVESGPCPANTLGWPVIVKPGTEDASVGIDQASVVTTQEQLDARVEYVLKTYKGPALVEQFIRGREFNVALVERDGRLDVLPFSEIVFLDEETSAHWPIVSFDAKWRPGTRDFDATPARNPADVTPELEAKVSDLARKAFRLVGCRDYARVDFRVDAAGNPFILEVNPNPCISPLAGLAAALETAKVSYPDFLLGLVKAAVRRGKRPESADDVGVPATATAAAKPTPSGRTPKVRPAKRTDRDALAALAAALDLPAVANTFESFTRRIRHDGSACLVVPGGGERVAGAAVVRRTDAVNGAFALDLLGVSPAVRGQGLGRALFQAAEAFAAENGGRLVQADASSGPAHSRARRFLLRLGFTQVAEVPDYYKDGYARLSFVKPLPAPATGSAGPKSSAAPA